VCACPPNSELACEHHGHSYIVAVCQHADGRWSWRYVLHDVEVNVTVPSADTQGAAVSQAMAAAHALIEQIETRSRRLDGSEH
jgi:hypothetical protein